MLIILDKIIINPSLIQISEKYNYIYTQEENLTNIAWHQICTSNKTNHTDDKTTPIQFEHHNSKINLLSIYIILFSFASIPREKKHYF